MLQYPVFRNKFIYDPDFSMLLTSPDPGPQQQQQPSANRDGILASDAAFQPWIVAVVVVSVVFILFVAILIGFLVKRAAERRNQVSLRNALDRSMQIQREEYVNHFFGDFESFRDI